MFCDTTCYTGSSSRIVAGWAAGGGFEYALGANWSAKVEYLFVTLGSDSFQTFAPVVIAGLSSLQAYFSDTMFATVRGGLNFHF